MVFLYLVFLMVFCYLRCTFVHIGVLRFSGVSGFSFYATGNFAFVHFSKPTAWYEKVKQNAFALLQVKKKIAFQRCHKLIFKKPPAFRSTNASNHFPTNTSFDVLTLRNMLTNCVVSKTRYTNMGVQRDSLDWHYMRIIVQIVYLK